MYCRSHYYLGVHGGFTKSGGNFRKNNWSKGRLDVGRVRCLPKIQTLQFHLDHDERKHSGREVSEADGLWSSWVLYGNCFLSTAGTA